MTFNTGFLCTACGPIEKAVSRTLNKSKVNVCPECQNVVRTWERPLNERDGRCRTCSGGGFTLKMQNRELLRICKRCEEVYNTDTKMVVTRGVEQ